MQISVVPEVISLIALAESYKLLAYHFAPPLNILYNEQIPAE